MFKQMDDDGSGRISYDELRRGVREQLHLSKTEMAEARLRSLWKALDDDASGWISAGEFGRFMRKGEAEGQAARVKAARAAVERRRQLALEEQRQAMDALVSHARPTGPVPPPPRFCCTHTHTRTLPRRAALPLDAAGGSRRDGSSRECRDGERGGDE